MVLGKSAAKKISSKKIPPLLSIVIPSNNRTELLDEAVRSILAEPGFDGRCEICISDNSSGEATHQFFNVTYATSEKLVYRRSLDAPSLDENVNKVIEMANGEYVWIFGDDDLIVKDFLLKLLEYLEKVNPDVLILNSSSFQNADVVETSRVPLADKRIYGPSDNDAFLGDLGGYLTYVGGIVIRKRLWVKYFRQEMIGTYFAHIDTICRIKPGRMAYFWPQPGINMRLHTQTWTAKHFEIWNIHFPAVIWGLVGYSDEAKQSVISPYPLKSLKRILASRAYGRFNMEIYRAVLMRSECSSIFVKGAGLVIALLPREWFRLLFILFIRIVRRQQSRSFSPELALAQLGKSVKGSRPRIALLCHSLTGTGGTERVISTLSRLLSAHFDVYELSFDPPGSVRFFQSPARYIPLGPSLKLPLSFRSISYTVDAFRLWRAKRRLGVVLTISNLWRADLLSILSMGSDRKIAICHINIIENKTNFLLLRYRILASLIYRRFDRVVSVSLPLGDEMRNLFHLDKLKSHIIHNCVPARVIEHPRQMDQMTRIVWCGRFVPEKNILTLIDIFAGAVKSNPLLQLVLIGDGPLRRQSESMIKNLGLRVGNSIEDKSSQVILTGFVLDPISFIASCDFQVLPSIAEGLGLVLIEGFSVAIPALASDCSGGGVHDAMGGASAYRPGRMESEQTGCGFLLPVPESSLPKTIDIWRSHMLSMAKNVELRLQLAAGAKERARLFSPEIISPKWLQLLEEVL